MPALNSNPQWYLHQQRCSYVPVGELEHLGASAGVCTEVPEWKMHTTNSVDMRIEFYFCEKHYRMSQHRAAEKRVEARRARKRSAAMKAVSSAKEGTK